MSNGMTLPCIKDVSDLRGERVFVRSSLNVPVKNGVVQNEFRLRRALPTLEFLQKAGARVVLTGHIGRSPEDSLRPVYKALGKYIEVQWCEDIGAEAVNTISSLAEGDVLLLENLRKNPGETANEASFSEFLASLADIYVNDAFSASHREHASIVGVPKHLPSYVGITFLEEYTELRKATQPRSPSLFILGGAKFETKLPLVEQYADLYDHVFIGGALANDVWKTRGFEVGRSVVSGIDLSQSALMDDGRLLLPTDVTVQNETGDVRVTTPEDVQKDEIIFDTGPETTKMLTPLISGAKAILWNGPLGYFEGGFDEYTKQCAELVAKSDAHSIVGGGDTIAAIESLHLHDKFGFVSTAGGAMLVFLETGTLPGIEALVQKRAT